MPGCTITGTCAASTWSPPNKLSRTSLARPLQKAVMSSYKTDAIGRGEFQSCPRHRRENRGREKGRPEKPASPPIKADEGHFAVKPAGSGKAAAQMPMPVQSVMDVGTSNRVRRARRVKEPEKWPTRFARGVVPKRSEHDKEGILHACGAFMQGSETKAAPEKPAGVPFAERLKIKRMTRKLPP